MMGEELNAAEVTPRGLRGDRAYALIDASTGKVVSAKNPRKWPNLFDFRAAIIDEPGSGQHIPTVRITLPDGSTVTSLQSDLVQKLSDVLGQQVTLESAVPESPVLEEYWPDMEELDHRDTVTDESIPPGTFFDGAAVHLLTTATLDRLRQAYPDGRFETRRFRPNIVVSPATDAKQFVENDWVGHTAAIGEEVRLSITMHCPRCVMTTLPQSDLPKDPGILRTAAQQNRANVGVYASVLQGGTIRRGDTIKLDP
jgi:uncharacterized protein YcbX